MRKVWILFLLSLCLDPVSQSIAQVNAKIVDGKFHLERAHVENAAEPVVLTKHWKYHAGDNPAWAAPAFDDSDWEHIDTQLLPFHLPQSGWRGIGWFRLHLSVHPALQNQPLVFMFSQVGASEIYLNGQRIYTWGKKSLKFRCDSGTAKS